MGLLLLSKITTTTTTNTSNSSNPKDTLDYNKIIKRK